MRFMTNILGAALLIVAGTTVVLQGQQAAAFNRPSEPLKAYLRTYLSLGGKVAPDTTTRITAHSVQSGHGKPEEDIIILVTGCRQWWLYAPDPGAYRIPLQRSVGYSRASSRLLPSRARPDARISE